MRTMEIVHKEEPLSLHEARRKEKLRKLFNRYIIPKGLDIDVEGPLEDSHQAISRDLESSRSAGSLNSYRVLHNKIIYASPETSRHILRTNKETYEKMMNRLRSLEQKEYIGAKKRCTLRKQKLNDLNFKVRQTRPGPNSYYFQQAIPTSRLPALPSPSKKEESDRHTPSICFCIINSIESVVKILKARATFDFPFKWRSCEVKGARPETREGGSFTRVLVPISPKNFEERAYLFAGLSRDLHATLHYIKPNPLGRGHVWEYVEQGEPSRKRYGHSACAWEYLIMIVGGSRLYNKETKRRDCLNDVLVYNTVSNHWDELRCDGLFERRRYHTTCIVGKYMVANGGVNAEQQFLNDTMALYLGKFNDKDYAGKAYRWIKVHTKGASPPKVAYHTCQLVLNTDRLQYNIEQPDLYSMKESTSGKIALEGIYFFGGKDEKGAKNTLYVLKIGKKPCEWVTPTIEGPAPLARYGHSMNYYPNRALLIIFGGRNDENYCNDVSQAYLNDVWILDLERMKWIQWDQQEQIVPVPRYSHCSVILGPSVLIFGGLSEENYCKADVHVLTLEKAFDFLLKPQVKEEKKETEEENEEEERRVPVLSMPITVKTSRIDIKAEEQRIIKRRSDARLLQRLNIYQQNCVCVALIA
eukprot:TRINITY_DN1492_c0_g2_i1.p1 TRINITY_DN1492_c0_g2~~TRINITY_DN1492_c0_g2_i1.p1  ORF type:complete len:660 (+),score=34.59 TRINITY_DN1492_c0_g2_i1:57-1982(+)